MRINANLPENLWPEYWSAAGFLHNRSPRQQNSWKSPSEILAEWFKAKRVPGFNTSENDFRPDWNVTFAYGCRAYPLITAYKAGKQKIHFKTNPRAHVGYLVGYRASNIYRIWVPALDQVITTRDVQFDESKFFDPDEEDEIGLLIREYRPVAERLDIPEPQSLDQDISDFIETLGGDISDTTVSESDADTEEEIPHHSESPLTPEGLLGSQKSGVDAPGFPEVHRFLTPDLTPEPPEQPHALIVDRQQGGPEGPEMLNNGDERDTIVVHTEPEMAPPAGTPEDREARSHPDEDRASTPEEPEDPSSSSQQPETSEQPQRRRRRMEEVWPQEPSRHSARIRERHPGDHATFATFLPSFLEHENDSAGTFTALHAVFFAATKSRPHRDTLTKEPKSYRDLHNHPYGAQFKEACKKELHTLLSKGTWRVMDQQRASGRILPLKWVFLYKFDADGFLQKCKARICVRGDLQDTASLETTYAATLAAKSFRVAMAVAAKFDLEVKHYDVVNAFLNANVNGDVFCRLPDGFKDLGFLPADIAAGDKVAQLDKALYGLRDSPLLWYKEFSTTLEQHGLTKSSEEPCVFTTDKCLILFYVDDILVLYRKQDEESVEQLFAKLEAKYEMRSEGDVKWFLGIRVIRDRKRRRLWLCQDSYIEKITQKFALLDGKPRFPSVPAPQTPLERFEGQANPQSIKRFQEKVGSILYAAITVRPDVARAAAQLSRHLRNPSREHHAAADQAILYLYATRFLAIEYGGPSSDEALVIASDASFADDEESRRSSQGYIMTLFGGPVVWKSGLQDTVTTSTTEAELLGVERTTKESFSLERFFRDIALDLGSPLRIHCDNLQTIRLIIGENERIATRLRHVDVQNMWLRQEFKKGRFEVSYLPTGEMPADGLTKSLSRQRFEHFRSLLNLQDVRELVPGQEETAETMEEAEEASWTRPNARKQVHWS